MKLLKLLCCFCPPVPAEEGEVDDMAMSRAQAVGKKGKKKANPSKKKMRKEAKRLKHQMIDMKKKEVMMDMETPMDMVEVAKEAADVGSKALQQPTTTANLTTGAEEPVDKVTRETMLDHGETDGASSVSSSSTPCDLLAALNSVANADGDIVALLDHLKAANMTHMAVESRPQLRQPAARVNVDRPGLRQPAARVNVDRPGLRQPAAQVNMDRESPMGGKPALRLRLDTGPEKLIPKETFLDNPQADGSMVNGGQWSSPAVDSPHSAVIEAVIDHLCLSTDTADDSGSGDAPCLLRKMSKEDCDQNKSDLNKDRVQLAEGGSERCPSPELCEHQGLQQPEMGLTAAVTGEMSAGGGEEDEAEKQA
ncbi:uncharacterized protein LOC134453547 isoform X1 [Engraulis encrasicolus]|uniref:uncharacterized protein LOC134453547 isoform X1 n=1 Tax=Engraulis encrasicolus TaxID=184585 RepID=UPI002FD6B257